MNKDILSSYEWAVHKLLVAQTDRTVWKREDSHRRAAPVLARGLSISLWDVTVGAGVPVDGCTLRELDSHPGYDMLLIGVWRADVYYVHPPSGLQIQAGDQLLLSGTPGQLLRCARLFSRPDHRGPEQSTA